MTPIGIKIWQVKHPQTSNSMRWKNVTFICECWGLLAPRVAMQVFMQLYSVSTQLVASDVLINIKINNSTAGSRLTGLIGRPQETWMKAYFCTIMVPSLSLVFSG